MAQKWYESTEKRHSEIAALRHRDRSSIIHLLVLKRERRQDGRPKALIEALGDATVKK